MLHVHRADRADRLLAVLARELAAPPADPFAPELVAVPTRGIERWITQGLALTLGAQAGRTDGVVANVLFPPPRRLLDEAVARACDVDPAKDPWAPQRVLWALLEVVEAHRDAPWLTTLADHLGDGRLAAAQHLVGLFDRYALQRPAMVRAWAAGDDVDGSGDRLPEDRVWQAALWRELRSAIGAPSPAERLEAAVQRLRDEPAVAELPDRLAVFGLTRLPPGHVDVLRALAARREVHLLLLHPSPALWDAVAPEVPVASPRRAQDPTRALPSNRLLASWGRDARELQLVLGTETSDRVHPLPPSGRTPTHLLARLQEDVRRDRRGGPYDADRSVEVHACHGRARQVEVLRDVVLHALQDDPTLEPRDVVVMCPDIEAFAPLVQATFGPGAGLPDLRVRLADRALRQVNPVVGTIGRLLELADGRLTASQVLDLADRAPVRRRFGWDDDDLSRLEDWTARSGVRWGLDAPHRAPFKLSGVPDGTWRAGLDRVLLGAAMTEDGAPLVGGVLPFDDVESGAIDLAGRFAEFVDRLDAAVAACKEKRSLTAWAAVVGEAADALTACAPADLWQRAELDRLLADLEADAAGREVALGLPELRDLLADHLRGRPTRAGFRTGHLTFCTLNPMRSVPHRVVCLLGLDDDRFPRKAPWDGDDLVAADAHLGDHDGRTEDRQLLLDALMAAEDKLVVLFTGRDERTNVARPPAVPVGELLDVIGPSLQVVQHPLQGFDPRAFTPGELGAPEPFSFDPVALEGAEALRGKPAERPPFLTAPLAAPVEAVLALEDLVRFTQHPVRALLRRRLDLSFGRDEDEPADDLPIELDGLEQWGVNERLLKAVLAGRTPAEASLAELARGVLPPGKLADEVFRKANRLVVPLAAAAREVLGEPGDLASLDARLVLPDGRLVHGTVPGLRDDVVQVVTASRVSGKHRLAAWTRLLALTVARPDRPWRSVVIGRAPFVGSAPRSTVRIVRTGPLVPEEAARRLDALVDLHDRALREPAPLAVLTSAAYAQGTPAQARSAWETSYRMAGEQDDPEHLRVWSRRGFDELLAEPARPDEPWQASEPSRFGRWARRLWDGPLAHEQVEDR